MRIFEGIFYAWCFLTESVEPRITLQSSVTVENLGRNVQLAGITYYIPGFSELTVANHAGLQSASSGSFLLPFTHVAGNTTYSFSDLESTLETYASQDDVWSTAFANTVFLSGTTASAAAFTGRADISNVIVTSSTGGLANFSSLMPGPYFADINSASITVYKAFRTYADDANSFYYGVISRDDTSFQVLSSSSPNTDGRATIAVPSRLYYAAPNVDKPLSGVRLGVKDLYDLAGLKTSMGSRAWFRLYPAVSSTATCIQYLIDLGAVVVGKTRLSQFANGQNPTGDWVDNHDPFNARGDGYQDPSSSSSGSGSAQSKCYDWIDMNIGSDTGGSIRAPAAVSGVFGNRPTQYIMSLDGALSLSPEMDTPAFVARSASDFASWGKAWYSMGNSSVKTYPSFPPRLLYPIDTPGLDTTLYPSPGFFPVANDEAQAMYTNFTNALEKFLGTQHEIYDFYTAYKNETGVYPVEQLGGIWQLLTSYEQYHNVLNPFFQDYEFANGGDSPYVDPPVQLNMQYGQNLTASRVAEALGNKTIYKNWSDEHLLKPMLDESYCSSALLIHPIAPGTVSYRDTYYRNPLVSGESFVWNQYSISQLAGIPEVVIPIGQLNYTSRITKTTKYLPVVVSINAAAGCDWMLFNLVQQLAEQGIIPSEVQTGQMTF